MTAYENATRGNRGKLKSLWMDAIDDRRVIEYKTTGKIDDHRPNWQTLSRLRLGKYAPMSGAEREEWLDDFAGATSDGSTVKSMKGRWISYPRRKSEYPTGQRGVTK